jgi:hypothetical protein
LAGAGFKRWRRNHRFELDTSLGFVLLLVLDDAGRELAAVGAWGEG